MAAPIAAIVAKKAAAILLTDKRTWTVIGSVIGGIVVFIILTVTVLFGGLNAHNTAKEEGNAAMRTALDALFADGEPPESLPAEYRDGLEKLRTVQENVEAEIQKQGLGTDPLKAQIILLCALRNRVDDADFYADYAACFKGAENDDQIFDAIIAKFGVEITKEDRGKILRLYERAQAYVTVPPGNIHAEIAELAGSAPAVPASDGPLRPPVQMENWKAFITSGYGYRDDPVTGEKRAVHAGLDIGVPENTDIYAAKAGIVLFARTGSDGYGNYIAVNHGGGVVTLYAHCSELLASAGDPVTAETVIARSGNSGKSTGPHLHFEVCADGKPLNPIRFLE
jgi:murein DD-endopeptidase MepM/ murein hydrolase activator NlpD